MLRPTAQTAMPQKDYMLTITFDNGEIRILDVKPFIKGSWYGMLSDPEYFRQVSTDGYTLVWPEGQDLCPDDVYTLSKSIKTASVLP